MTPDDAQLPFLVLHGALVWKLLLALMVGGGLAALLAWRARSARKVQRADLALRLARATAQLAEGAVTVRGTLRDGEVMTLDLDKGYVHELRHHQTGTPWLDVGGVRVELDGALAVWAARDVTTRWGTPPQGTPATLADGTAHTGIARTQLRWIARGTEVIAEGVLAHRASSEETAYRESAGGWVLGPEGTASVRLDAVAPRARPPALGPLRAAAFTVALLVCSYGLLRFVGKRALARLEHRELPDDGRAVVLSNLDAYAIAAAMPGSRAKALEHLDEDLERHRYHDAASVRRRMAVGELRYGCKGSWGVLYGIGHYEDALATADRCHLDVNREWALRELGRYEEAAALIAKEDDRDRYDAPIAILAGDWALAADLAGRAAEAATRPSEYRTEDAADSRWRHRDELRFRCLAAWFGERAGGPDAAPRISELSTQRDGEGCALVAAERASDRAVALSALLVAWGEADDDYSLGELAFVADGLLWAEGTATPYRDDSFYEPASMLTEEGGSSRGWLARWAEPALTAHGAAPLHQAVAHAWEAALAVVEGDPAAAQQHVDAVQRLLAGELYADSARDFASAVALHGDRVDLPAARLAGAADTIALRRGEDAMDFVSVSPDECEGPYREAIRAAQDGDGAPLGAVMQRCRVPWMIEDARLLGVLPRIARGREAVAEALRWWDLDGGSSDPPFGAATNAALRRDLNALAGNADEAARWQAIVDRHVAPLRDRDRLVALLLWDP